MHDNLALLDFIPMGAFVLDAGYKVLFWNKCMETWTGIPASELLQQDIRQRFPDLGHPKLTSRLEGVFLGGPPIIFSAQLHRYIIPAPLPGGGMRLQNTMVNAVRSTDGYQALFTLQDVTEISRRLEQYIAMRNHALNEVEERRKAEAEIREREAMYRSIFEKIRAAKLLIDPGSGDIVDANTAACYFYGYPYSRLMRMGLQQLSTLAEDELLAEMRLAVEERQNYFESTHRLANGSLRHVEIHSAPIEVRHQTLLYSIILDVTERRRAEEALRQSERKFRLLFELAGDMIVVHDLQGRILDANQLCCEKLGLAKEELLDRNILDIAPDTEAQLGERLALLQESSPVSFETEVCDAEGVRMPVEVQSRRMVIDGEPAIVSIGRDISVRRKMENLREEVERITRHDLKNPLGAILGLPEVLLLSENLTADERELVSVIQNAGYTMLNMINQSLDLYKMESGTYDFQPARVSLLRLLERILTELREQLETRRLEACIEQAPAGGRPIQALGDEMLCYSMISNLLTNAVEASPMGGKIHLRLALDDGRVLLEIHNKGAIPAAIRETFLNKYVTAGKSQGTGLGTYSAMLMAQVQGGAISYETSDEAGTTVRVRLPAAPPRTQDDA